jgi:hypothetical protein
MVDSPFVAELPRVFRYFEPAAGRIIPEEVETNLPGMFDRIRKPEIFGEDFELLLDLLFDDVGRGRGHAGMVFDGLAPEAEALILEGGFQG